MSRKSHPSGQCRRRSFRSGLGLPQPFIAVLAEPRLLCSDLVTLRLRSPGLAPRDISAILEEISPHDACLQFEESIPVETSVDILFTESAEGENLTGTVVQCLPQRDLGFFTEVHFTPGCTWSPKRYRPLHLFDPSGLLASREMASEA